MSKLTIGVVRGGPTKKYPESLRSGRRVLDILPERYGSRDVFISRDGTWHIYGIAKPPAEVFNSLDCVFNALHGSAEEISSLQRMIERSGLPYTGSSGFAQALSSGRSFLDRHVALHVNDSGHGFYKPSDEPKGKDLVCAVIEDFRAAPHYATIPAEVRSVGNIKDVICPSQVSEAEKRRIEDLAIRAHKLVGARHYSLAECGITEEGTVYLDNIIVHPELGEGTVFEELLDAVGISARQLVETVISNTMEKRYR